MSNFMITQVIKKHKGLKMSTRDMDFDSYSERLADLNKFSTEFFR